MLELVVFIIGSGGILLLSLPSLAKPFSHGFPRFFAFEAILGLGIMNAHAWFVDPLSIQQVVSWVVFLGSIFLAGYALLSLRRYGKPDYSIQESRRIGFEKTTQLVALGPYRFIRHPMYASLLCLAWGIFLKQIDLLSGLLVLSASLALYITAVFEEKENLHIFGDEYRRYMQSTKRFIPFIL